MIDPDDFFSHGHPLGMMADGKRLMCGFNGNPFDLDDLSMLWGILSDNANGSEELEHSGPADDLTVKYVYYFSENPDEVEEREITLHGKLIEFDGREVFMIDRIDTDDSGIATLRIEPCATCDEKVRLGSSVFEGDDAVYVDESRKRIKHFRECAKK